MVKLPSNHWFEEAIIARLLEDILHSLWPKLNHVICDRAEFYNLSIFTSSYHVFCMNFSMLNNLWFSFSNGCLPMFGSSAVSHQHVLYQASKGAGTKISISDVLLKTISWVCFHVNSGIVFQSTNEKLWPNYEYQNNRDQAGADFSDLIQAIYYLNFWGEANYLFSKTLFLF